MALFLQLLLDGLAGGDVVAVEVRVIQRLASLVVR